MMGKAVGFSDLFLAVGLQLLYLVRFSFPLLLVPVFLWVYFYRKTIKNFQWDLVFLFGSAILAITVLMGIFINFLIAPAYVSSSFPLLNILAAMVLVALVGEKKWLLGILATVMVFTNALNLPLWPKKAKQVSETHAYYSANRALRKQIILEKLTLNRLDFLIKAFLFDELAGEYVGPIEGIVKYLQENAKKGDTFMSTRDWHTLHFATGLPIARDVSTQKPPSWMIWRLRKPWSSATCGIQGETPAQTHRRIQKFIKDQPYELIVLDYPDNSHENMPFIRMLLGWPRRDPESSKKVILFRYRGFKWFTSS